MSQARLIQFAAAAAAAWALWELWQLTRGRGAFATPPAVPVPAGDTPASLSVWDAITASNAADARRGVPGIWSNLGEP